VPVHVTLSSVMVYRVGGTIGRSTVGTPRECLIARSLENCSGGIASEQTPTCVLMHVPEAECPVAHLCEHSRLVRRIDITVIVVNEHAPGLSSGRLHIDIPSAMRGQDFCKENLRVDFRNPVPVSIDFEDMREPCL